jgi:hypothetical protein
MREAEQTIPHAGAAARLAAARNFFRQRFRRPTRALLACAAFACLALSGGGARAQQRFQKTYRPDRPTVRVLLLNRTGTIEIEGWEKQEIKVVAEMESPAAKFTPVMDKAGLRIDVVGDTRGRENVGDVNFRVYVPADAAVELKTMIGNISVRNLRGAAVVADVTSSGDIDLTGIRAFGVMASNISGNIFFDAELMRGGTYTLHSTSGNINLRITGGSGFTLTALAPRTRVIDLGGFARTGDFHSQNDNRAIHGKFGDGSARLMPTSLRGSIVFVSR